MKLKLLAVVSDLHCGSEVGLSPRQFTLRGGNVVTLGNNACQNWLADEWDNAIQAVQNIAGKDPMALLINGDATEGVHHHNNKDLVAAEIEKHVEMAATCLRPLRKLARKVFVIKGTECHTANIEDKLAQELKAEGKCAKDKWLIEINGCLIDATHHVGVTSRAYLEASQYSIAMGNARLNYARLGHRIPNVYLRGHRHCGGWFSDGTGMMAVTGGWQFLTRHGHKVVPDSIPSPTVMVLDWPKASPGNSRLCMKSKASRPRLKSRVYSREELMASAQNNWLNKLAKEFAPQPEIPPKGYYTAQQIAKKLGTSISPARVLIVKAVKAGKIKRVMVRMVRSHGKSCPVPYYGPP